MVPRFPVYLFDIDGTLLDSAPDICGAMRQVLESTERPDVPFDFLRSYIGRHLVELFGDLFPHYSPERIEIMIQEYRRVYPARGHAQTVVYPGVVEALEALGGRKATATTKGSATTRTVLEQFGLAGYFDHVQGTDGFAAKPAPNVLLAAMEVLGARPDECLMVGDSAADMEAGRRAGVRVCSVTYGYGRPEELARWKPDYCVKDLRELVSQQSGMIY